MKGRGRKKGSDANKDGNGDANADADADADGWRPRPPPVSQSINQFSRGRSEEASQASQQRQPRTEREGPSGEGGGDRAPSPLFRPSLPARARAHHRSMPGGSHRIASASAAAFAFGPGDGCPPKKKAKSESESEQTQSQPCLLACRRSRDQVHNTNPGQTRDNAIEKCPVTCCSALENRGKKEKKKKKEKRGPTVWLGWVGSG